MMLHKEKIFFFDNIIGKKRSCEQVGRGNIESVCDIIKRFERKTVCGIRCFDNAQERAAYPHFFGKSFLRHSAKLSQRSDSNAKLYKTVTIFKSDFFPYIPTLKIDGSFLVFVFVDDIIGEK